MKFSTWNEIRNVLGMLRFLNHLCHPHARSLKLPKHMKGISGYITLSITMLWLGYFPCQMLSFHMGISTHLAVHNHEHLQRKLVGSYSIL